MRYRFSTMTVVGILCAGLIGSTALAAGDYLGVVPPTVSRVPKIVKTTCSACHGLDGNSVSPAFPNLAGQNYNYLLKELENFRSGVRSSAIMKQMIVTIPKVPDNRNLKQIAAYFAEQQLGRHSPGAASQPKPSQKTVALGYRIYFQGLRAQKVPACAACHLTSGKGIAPMAIPGLSGQHAAYVATELKRFASGVRHNSLNGVMQIIAQRLNERQIEAVSLYMQEMRPSLLPGSGLQSYGTYVRALKSQPVPGVKASDLHTGNKQ